MQLHINDLKSLTQITDGVILTIPKAPLLQDVQAWTKTLDQIGNYATSKNLNFIKEDKQDAYILKFIKQ